YGLPDDFPGIKDRPAGDPYARVAHVETALASSLNAANFQPHLVLHEYEAWIFSAPLACAWVFDDPRVAGQLVGIAGTAGGAERIDDGPATAPSKRLIKVFDGYRKTLHGPMAVAAIGLGAIRNACPHANAWLTWLEGLG